MSRSGYICDRQVFLDCCRGPGGGDRVELIGGVWVMPGEDEPDAVVSYTTEPSPETGHVGWVWWARGKMGDAPTMQMAQRDAERSLLCDLLAAEAERDEQSRMKEQE